MRPIDLSKFRKEITKSIPGISIGFSDPDVWIPTGNYALNYLISGDFNRGIPLSRVSVFAGQSGAGKSLLVSGSIARNAQALGVMICLIDSEAACDQTWLTALGVDTSPDKLMKINASMIDDVARIISDFMKDYKTTYGSDSKENRPRVLFIIDSLGNLQTPVALSQFETGQLKGDMGHKPRALKALVTNCVNMFADQPIGLICTQHTYASQNQFAPDDVISGGAGPIYASSIVVNMQLRKLKEDEDGNKIGEVRGIRSAIKVVKTRYNKPFEEVEIKVPYDHGIDPYSGLVDLFEKNDVLEKDGNKLRYVDHQGQEHKLFRKQIGADLLDLIMTEWDGERRHVPENDLTADLEKIT